MSTVTTTLAGARSMRRLPPPSSTASSSICSENTVASSDTPEDTVGRPIISYEEYHPYGSTSWHARTTGEVSAKRYRYTGKEKDDETGLYYHGARHMAAWLGRWTAADPSGVQDGVNRYAYVRGNPVRLQDPTGRGSWAGAFDSINAWEPTSYLESAEKIGLLGLATVGKQTDAIVDFGGTVAAGAKQAVTHPLDSAITLAKATPAGQLLQGNGGGAAKGLATQALVGPAVVAGVGMQIKSALSLPQTVAEGGFQAATGTVAPTRALRAAVVNNTPISSVTGKIDTSLGGVVSDAVIQTEDAVLVGGGVAVSKVASLRAGVGAGVEEGIASFASEQRVAAPRSAVARDALLQKAVQFRDDLAAEVQRLYELGVQDRPPAVVGAVNRTTGQVVATTSTKTMHAEDVAKVLLGDGDITMTGAVRPRPGGAPYGPVPVCGRCELNYGRSAFSDDATFKLDKLPW